MKYVCSICGYVYDEAKEGTPFAGLPDNWVCPVCRAGKGAFVPENKSEQSQPRETVKRQERTLHGLDEGVYAGDMRKLSAGELSAVCSNLARGCEKQYKDREAQLYRRLADYFAAAVPEEAGADRSTLSALIQNDLQEGYPGVRSVAAEEGDRGTLRICTWGEKVTAILNSLLQRYEKEGESFLKNTQIWVCTVCGFVYVGDQAPELCPVCKVPAWKFEKIERRNFA